MFVLHARLMQFSTLYREYDISYAYVLCLYKIQLPEEETPVRSVSMAADGSFLVAGNNQGNFYVWKTRNRGDMTELEAVTKIPAHSKYITKCLVSPDTRYVWQMYTYSVSI